MKKRIYGMLLMGAMVIASVSMFTSCKDYDDDINDLKKQIDGLNVAVLQTTVSNLQSELTSQKGTVAALETQIAKANQGVDAVTGQLDNFATKADLAAAIEELAKATATQEAVEAALAKAQEALDAANEAKAAAEKGGVTEADLKALEDQIAKVSAAAAAIDPKLDAIGKWQESVNGILEAVQKNVKTQQDALDNLKKALEEAGNNAALKALVDELSAKIDKAATADDVKKAIDDLKANLADEVAKAVADIQQNLKDADVQNAKNISDAKKELTETMQGLSNKVDGFSTNINALTIFVKRNLTSLVFRPSTYYGGIEGVEVFSFNVKKEYMEDKYHYFHYVTASPRYTLSDYGYAEYHVNPTNVDLTDTKIDFYSWLADIKEPVVGDGNESTRSGKNLITPIFDNFDALVEDKASNFSNGILTVPFQANIGTIATQLAANKGTIMALQMTKKNDEGNDTTVTSDYAIVYPVIADELLICDNAFKPTGPGAATADHIDDIKAGQNIAGNDLTPNSYHLHRNFSYLAMATTPATHKVKYDESLNISELLETHYLDQFAAAQGVAIRDTAWLTPHVSTAELNNGNVAFDGDASVTKAAAADGKLHCGILSAEAMERLGLVYDVHLVDYTLGSNVTGESVHMEVLQNEDGEFVAYPRDVTAAGKTITGTTATPASVGRMPILCIELKDTKHNNQTITFAWMKLLISDKVVNPEQKTVPFELGDYFMDCGTVSGALTWSQVEYNLLRTLGMSKETFDATFTYDWIPNTDVTQAKTDVSTTTYIKSREGYQFNYDEENGVFVMMNKTVATPGAAAYTCPTQDEKNYYQRHGKVTEEWNVSDQGVEDATTHILRWSFNDIEKFALYKYLKTSKGGGLKDNGNDWVNKKAFSTYVRYKRNNATGEPAVYIKLTIPAGKIHFAKGNLDGNKILSFWYNLNSKTNAENDSKAKEVRVNVPVPTPAATGTDIRNYGPADGNHTWFAPLQVDQDNLLLNTEFVKDLHDFFKNGKLGASILKIGSDQKFPNLAASALIPEFEFILPSKDLGNATFDASSKGTWNVRGFSGSIYTLGIFYKDDPTTASGEDAGNEIRIISGKYPDGTDIVIPVYPGNILASISNDNDGHMTPATPIQSVVKFHGGGVNASTPLNWVINAPKNPLQDDILNAASHNDLLESGFTTKATAPKSGANQTFTAYVGINITNACAPVTFDDMWFNVRFIRPLDLDQPAGALMTDAPNDWQKVNIMNFASVTDWRDYKGDKTDATGGNEVFAAGKYWFDYVYYGVSLSTNQASVLTDAFLGTDSRAAVASTAAGLISIDHYAMSQLENVSAIPNFQLELDPADATGRTIRYKNNSGINGGFHIFIPVYMEYVFGTQNVKQVKYITVGIQKSVAQPQARTK